MWYCLSSVRMSRGLLMPLSPLPAALSCSKKASAATDDLHPPMLQISFPGILKITLMLQ